MAQLQEADLGEGEVGAENPEDAAALIAIGSSPASTDLAPAELAALGHDELAMVVPKLCLLRAVLEACAIGAVVYVPAIGSCAGLLISNERFENGALA